MNDIFKGTSVNGGIAIGKIFVFNTAKENIKSKKVEDIDAELKRFEDAKTRAMEQLDTVYENVAKEIGSEAEIFNNQKMTLLDEEYISSITDLISSRSSAEYAIVKTRNNYFNIFSAIDDAYFKKKAIDIEDVSNRMLSILAGDKNTNITFDEPVILLADKLTPSQTMLLDKSKVLALVTKKGSIISHTAILARSLSIPAVLGINFPEDSNGKMAIVDGFNSTMTINPDEMLIKKAKDFKSKVDEQNAHLIELRGKKNLTLSGKSIEIYANIKDSSDVSSAIYNDAGGIGLFRTEFLFLGKDRFPGEEEQFNAYKEAAENMHTKIVVIRTLDIGADKTEKYFHSVKEENPALGIRGIRMSFKYPEIFNTQLRALLRASYFGNIAILFPMISSISEISRAKKMIRNAANELIEENFPFRIPEIGVMIETPAAALISDAIAQEVDFLSIGTNDLIQYTLAADRQNEEMMPYLNAHSPAILKLIKMTIDNGHLNGCRVGICGEMAADSSLTQTFMEMGVDELSVEPYKILKLREQIRNMP
ncbi:phosphoenolpyruvate--protein phosphotransferase [Acetitomaculum ruminis DSM 5522]|uniref:Phosphoenolpyruvate-protein phosphotransferase n=1 Tax=Acetitomaculum ruminis DSM 5522 TaxID=1120918 RepID=A0A1I0W2H7_9FIRM|nr:phosphoenolpyruvate--protein phosphotransferase [Acetitomaculum ruminis]SFA82842.1 phosphoenolpyruvate--protein phosphotransferase [Acetitomaculum ruminis DSM 5522]